MTDDELIAKAEKELASLTRCMSPDKVAKLEAHRLIALARIGAGEMARKKQGCKMAWKQGFCYGDPEYYPPAAIEALTPMASGTSVVVPVAELQPFADLVSTKNDYDLSTDDEIIRSAGTYGRDYCHITVGDCRRLKDRLHRKG